LRGVAEILAERLSCLASSLLTSPIDVRLLVLIEIDTRRCAFV